MRPAHAQWRPARYQMGHPPALPHRRQSVLERLCSLVVRSPVCQICRRKKLWSVSGWVQVDDPVYKDDNGCSVVCLECARHNPAIFGDL